MYHLQFMTGAGPAMLPVLQIITDKAGQLHLLLIHLLILPAAWPYRASCPADDILHSRPVASLALQRHFARARVLGGAPNPVPAVRWRQQQQQHGGRQLDRRR